MKLQLQNALTGSLLVFVAFLITNKTGAQRPPVSSVNETQERVIVKKSHWDPPVRISKVKTKKGVIELGKAYRDNDDWLRGLTVTLDNHSGKDVTHIDVEVLFIRPHDAAHEPPGVWHLTYGEDPFRYKTGEPIPPIEVKPIKNGDSFDVTLNDHDFDQLWIFLSQIKYSVVHSIEVRVIVIGFEDGTAWTGRMMRRDPTSPFGWSPVDPPEPHTNRAK